ncbi:MAG: chromosome segregation DNA-binding protein [Acidobacteriaceae bacterium]|nr:chromosome segregation DNA-binding protein [Acidobacteriaceae bacterium]
MAAIEEHKPAEKRRALGRGLDSLLPSGPRVVAAAPATAVSPPVVPSQVVPGSVAPAIAPASGSTIVPQPPAVPGEIAELHAAGQVKSPPKQSLDGAPAATIAAATRTGMSAPHAQEIIEIPLDLIDENPYQTRRTFNADALSELAESIKVSGLAQPIVVRPGANGRYVLVLGERRCRASKLAGNTTVPAIVRQLGNEQAAEMTVVENLQRQDLNCLEQAQAFARLSREFNLTQEQIGKRTGASRESVANYMRLLKLPPSVLDLVGQGKIGFSEARLLLEASSYMDVDALELLAKTTVEQGFTVKELKERVERLRYPEMDTEPRPPKAVDPNVRATESELQRLLGTRVHITDNKGKGRIVIEYRNLSDFDRVLELLHRD